MKEKTVTAGGLLDLALWVFLFLGSDFIVVLVPSEHFIIGRILVLLIWGAGVIYFTRYCRKNDIAELLVKVQYDKWLLLLLLFAIIYHFGMNMLLSGALAPQIIGEYAYYINQFGQQTGVIAFILQVIYYILETMLVFILLAFIQLAGEMYFEKKYIPWGGIGLALTWGAIHFIHSYRTGIYAIISSLVIGGLYTIHKKNVWTVFFMILLLFFI